jgi:uncharacterized membrane protein
MRPVSTKEIVSRYVMTACVAAVTLTLSLSPFLTGCGGSSTPTQNGSPTTPGTSRSRGRATFTIVWPEPTRLIPSASNSITISLRGAAAGAPLLGTQTISRPPGGQGTSTVTFENLEPGSLIATASAFPTTEGTGIAQASGQVPLTIVADETAQASLTMNSTIDHLEVSPPSIRYYLAKRFSSGPIFGDLVTVTARNEAGDVVLAPTANYTWTSSAPNNAYARLVGTETRVFSVGPVSVTTLTVRENESGKTAVLPVDIHGPLYTITDLGQQVTFSQSSDAYAINATGAVAGYAVVNNRAQAMVWNGGTARNIGSPPGLDIAYARDISDDGTVVGHGTPISFPTRGFVWKPISDTNGQFIDVPPPTANGSSSLRSINNQGLATGGDGFQGDALGPAFIFDIAARTSTRIPIANPFTPLIPSAINDSGIIVGNLNGSGLAYIYQNGVTSQLSSLRTAYAINKAGIIAGSQVRSSISVAAIAQNNQTTFLFPTENPLNSIAYGLNNQGVAVGAVDPTSTFPQAFVWGPGINGNANESTSELLNYLIDTSTGWQLQIARDINERGQIVGLGMHNGRRSAFLLTPIP